MRNYRFHIRKPLKNEAQMCKIRQNNDYNLTQPMVCLNCNAKNSYKYPNFTFRPLANPLWGVISHITVFPGDQTSFASHPSHLIPASQSSDDSISVILSSRSIDLTPGSTHVNLRNSYPYSKTFMQILRNINKFVF